ncbi:MAG: SiaC family regulatory phosphoprotein, partial [Bacteroidales bacterium]
EIKLEGRALVEDAFKFFQPLITWAKEFNADEINIEVNLEYFNTSVSKQLLDLFRTFDGNPNNKTINVKWLYEEGDDEMQESGEIYEDLLPRFNFTYKQYTES